DEGVEAALVEDHGADAPGLLAHGAGDGACIADRLADHRAAQAGGHGVDDEAVAVQHVAPFTLLAALLHRHRDVAPQGGVEVDHLGSRVDHRVTSQICPLWAGTRTTTSESPSTVASRVSQRGISVTRPGVRSRSCTSAAFMLSAPRMCRPRAASRKLCTDTP